MTDGQSIPPEAEPLRPRHVQRDEHTRNGRLATHHSSVDRTPEWPRVPLRAHERSEGGLLSHPFGKAGREDERGGAESYWNSGRWWSVCTRHEDSHRKRPGLP